MHDIYFQWIDPKNPPAGVTVTGLPFSIRVGITS